MVSGPEGHDTKLEQLLARCALGDRAAFQALYDGTAPQIYASLLRLLRRRDAAEDVLQETFVAVWRRAADYRADKGRPITWLMSIARYRALDILRRQGRELPMPEGLEPADESSDEEPDAMAGRAARQLSTCMERLGAEQQRCVRLAYVDGLTHADIARALSTPLGTVKSWLRRGLQALKQCMDAATAQP
jgi:RNA polymerase sigma-70 factor (ECF subfamily)